MYHHWPVATRERPPVATETGCTGRFPPQSVLLHQPRAQTEEWPGPWPSEGGNKTFATGNSSRSRKIGHSGAKPWHCPEPGCGLRFSYQGNLARHKRVHAEQDLSPCSCRSCGRPFGNRQALRLHQEQAAARYTSRTSDRWPSGVWPLAVPCEQLDTSARQSASTGHTDKNGPCAVRVYPGQIVYRVNPDNRTYSCPIRQCDNAFMTRQKLQRHIARHKLTTEYFCPQEGCLYSCGRKAWFTAHINKHNAPPTDTAPLTDGGPGTRLASPTEKLMPWNPASCTARFSYFPPSCMPVRRQAAQPDEAFLPLADDVLAWLAQQPTSNVANHAGGALLFSQDQPFEHWMDPPDGQASAQPLQAGTLPSGPDHDPHLFWW